MNVRAHIGSAFLSHFAHLFSQGLQCPSPLWITKVRASQWSRELQPLPPCTHPHVTAPSSKVLGRHLQGNNRAGPWALEVQATPALDWQSWSSIRRQTPGIPPLPFLQTPAPCPGHKHGEAACFRGPRLAPRGLRKVWFCGRGREHSPRFSPPLNFHPSFKTHLQSAQSKSTPLLPGPSSLVQV